LLIHGSRSVVKAAATKDDAQSRWINALVNAVKSVQEQGFHELILCSEAARPLVKSSTARAR